MSQPSVLERAFLTSFELLAQPDTPRPVTEFRFAEGRRWRFDFAWPEQRVAVELEGATWTRGRHTRGAGFAADCAKYNEAVALGWRVLRYTADMITDDPVAVIAQIEAVLLADEA